MQIPLGTTGTVSDSGNPPIKVKVEFDDDSGGYFIFEWRDGTSEHWDNWVEKPEEVGIFLLKFDRPIAWEVS